MKSKAFTNRSLSGSSDIDTIPSLSSKHNLKNNSISSTVMSSICFLHHSDHAQFEEIFKIIDGLELIQSLNITHFISKEIAEYATGKIEKCANDKCQNEISILCAYQAIYDVNHKNAIKLGYKWCGESNRYFCVECMSNVTTCDCMDKFCCHDKLKHISECDKCESCKSILFGCECGDGITCDYKTEWECHHCQRKWCIRCCYTEKLQCISCDSECCKQCRREPDRWHQFCVCNACHDDMIVECNKCNIKCKTWYKGSTQLYRVDSVNNKEAKDRLDMIKMIKCGYTECNVFICLNCEEKERTGKYIFCDETYCDYGIGVRCTQHTKSKMYCWTHKRHQN